MGYIRFGMYQDEQCLLLRGVDLLQATTPSGVALSPSVPRQPGRDPIDDAASGSHLTPESDNVGTRPWSVAARHFTRWRAEETGALDDLVRELTPLLWHVARSYGLDRQSSEDVVQTTWLSLVRNADAVRDPQAVLGWLTTTARREAWRVSKVSRRQVPMSTDTLAAALPETDGPEQDALLNDRQKLLWAMVAELSERCQRLLRVIAFEDRPDYAALALELEMPVGSIGPTRGRCLAKLRSLLPDQTDWSLL
jgi:RNA polymerase sigma factor (sigma-70 family)